MDHRDKLIARIREGKQGFGREPSGAASSSAAGPVRNKKEFVRAREFAESLHPPPPDLLPWDDYKAKFDIKLMRQAGHYVRRFAAGKFVCMPKPKGTPWSQPLTLVLFRGVDTGPGSPVCCAPRLTGPGTSRTEFSAPARITNSMHEVRGQLCRRDI